MKKAYSKKLICIVLAALVMVAVCLTGIFAGAKIKAVDVSTADELQAALANESEYIRVVADIVLDRTFYVTGQTTIFSEEAHTLTRKPSFAGDVFVVGETSKGKSALLNGENASLTLGKEGSDENNMLIFDGNSANMTKGVTGTFIFVSNSSIVNVYDNVTFQNATKSGNKKILAESYWISNASRSGGPVAMIASGTMNVYGGIFQNNSVNDENSDDNAPEEERNSTYGGAIYNYGNLNIFDGTFVNNKAARGGAIYNYRTLKVKKALFDANNGTAYGGAIYQAGSQYARTYLGTDGAEKGESILFTNNKSKSNGGAIYAYLPSVVVAYGDTTFRGNTTSSSGGALAIYGASHLNNVVFEQNTASSRGGAVYFTHITDEKTTRFSKVTNCLFTENTALHGGALATYASDATLKNGAIAEVVNCEFRNNTGTEDGGALYSGRKSTLTIDSCIVENNTSLTGAGYYILDQSTSTIKNTTFANNNAVGEGACGGAIAVRSSLLNIDKSNFNNNTAVKNGGGIYVSYLGTTTVNADVNITGSEFKANVAQNYGGAIYATQQTVEKKVEEVFAENTLFTANEALKGGAAYLTSGVEAYFTDVEFNANTNANIAGGEEDAYNGGALYLSESKAELDDVTFKNNSAKYNGGGLGAYSGSTLVLNKVTATENTATNEGGFFYNSGSNINVYNSTFKKNVAKKSGGAISLRSLGVTNVYTSVFEENDATSNGGAVYVYTGASESLLQDCSFVKNNAKKYGGAVYVSNASVLNMFNNTATENTAGNGAVLYETTTDSVVNLSGIKVSANKADKGDIIYGNTTKAILNIDKTNYVDADVEGALDDAYWANAIVNKLTVKEATFEIPSYEDYKPREKAKAEETKPSKAVPVTDVFNLGKKSSDKDINEDYAALKKLDNSSNFMSRNTTLFDNINGETVSVDTFVYQAGKKANNVTVGEGLLIYQAMLYKKANPDEEVYIDISAFRFSVEAAVNINRNSRYFGYMRNLVGQEYDEYGFVRISYLLVSAAKMGIHVNVIGQMDGYPISSKDPNLEEYFTMKLNDPCDPKYVKNAVIGDYLDFQYCYWTSYGDNDATDMMHTKLCAVSDYLDMNGVAHKNAVWTSSTNLDGIRDTGKNGNSKMQTATIVSDHEAIYRASANYLRLIAQYCAQEDVYLFRNLVNERTTQQIQMILDGKESKIPKDERIVYLGSKTDDVFELYFAPFGGSAVVWDEVYNPYCKYLRKMYNSDDYILFTWNNANYNNNFALGTQIEDVLVTAFHQNKNPLNKIYVNLENFDGNKFKDLKEGTDIGFKSFNQKDYGAIHSKDMQVSYSENGKRQYVSILNSLNIHGGSMWYQTNNLLVIKEDNMDKDSVFYTIAEYTTKGITEPNFAESKEMGRSFAKDDVQSIGTLSATPKTIEATIQVPKSVKGRAGVVVGNYNGGDGKQLNLEIYNGGKVRLFFNNGSKKVSCVFNKDIRSASPVNVAVTVDGKTATLYVNGEKIQTKTLSATYSGITKKFVIGGDNRKGNSGYFKGIIYSVSLFDDVRAASEIKRDASVVTSGASGLIYTTSFQTTSSTYAEVDVNGRSFDKSNAYSLGTLSSSPKTIEATINVPESINGRAGVIVGNYNNGKGKQLNLEVYTKGRVRLFFNNGSKEVSCLFSKDIRSSSPVNVAVTVEGKTAKLYVNGKLTETKKLSASYAGATSSFKVGGDNRKGNSAYFKGTIYSVALFSDVRTSSEIKQDRVFVLGNESGIITSRLFTSQKKAYSATKFTGMQLESNTAYELGKLSASPYTIEATVQVPKSMDTRAGVIVGNFDSNSTKKELNLEIYTKGRVRLVFHNGSKKVDCVFSKDIRSDKPVNIAVTIKEDKAVLYVNGKAVESQKLTAQYKGATADFKVGGDNRPGNTAYFKGTIYSVNLYSDVRTSKEVSRDANYAPNSQSSLIYSGDYYCKAQRFSAFNDAGTKLAANKFKTVEPLVAVPYTIEATIKVPTSQKDRAGVIVGNYNGGNGKQLNLEVESKGRIKLFINNGSEKVSCIFSTDIRSSNATDIAVTISGKTATLYVNGVKAEAKTLSASYKGSAEGFIIGGDNRANNTQYFKGTIYSVRLFADVRTQSEIKKDAIFVPENTNGLLYAGYAIG